VCIAKIGKVVKIEGNEALVKFGNKTERVNISFLKNLKVNDKIICSGKIAVEKID